MCTEVSIRDFDEQNLTFSDEVYISWLDIKSDSGFIREFNGIKYFYGKDNQIYNIEKKNNCKEFPLSNKEICFNQKIGLRRV